MGGEGIGLPSIYNSYDISIIHMTVMNVQNIELCSFQFQSPAKENIYRFIIVYLKTLQ